MKPQRPARPINLRGVPIIGEQRPGAPRAGKYFYFIGVSYTRPGEPMKVEGFEAWFAAPLTHGRELFRLGQGYAERLKELADQLAHEAARKLDPEAMKPDTPLPDVAPFAFEFLRYEPEGATPEPPAPKETVQ